MKHLIRRLSRVADSAQYSLLRSDSRRLSRLSGSSIRSLVRQTKKATSSVPQGHVPVYVGEERLQTAIRSAARREKKAKSSVPQGHVPVYVGEEMERFVVSAEVMNHPVFVGLLNRSAQEYGYEQKGVLHIPCHVLVFERIIESLRLGLAWSHDLQDLIGDGAI
ncbi:PREDICTED: auxin-responsive protein SAUR72 [Tarenaya hassleriana]|uniref:auxin-responsive protein SAUR72 n=1 Tax=Tarenaya hassleriana TaxID=28532 RepID=UPI0008FD3E40|nr:PREDICTED: auxin-responsive protein SAUR72 [Tarenaya hassleriana]